MNPDADGAPDQVGTPGASGAGPCELIAPFGDRGLVDLVVHDPDARATLLERSQNLPVVPLSLRAQYDLEMMAVGAFSPLDRFMPQEEYESVLYEMRLQGGELFPIPLAVPCREEVLRGHPREIALSDEQGNLLALLEVDEVYPADILREMRAVLGGRDSAHPLVIEAKNWPSHYLAGRPHVFGLPRHRLHGPRCLTPAQVRERLTAMGNSTVVAFQTRNPMHRIHEELTKRAMQEVGGGTLLIHPAVGVTRPQDVAAALRVEAYEVLVDNYYDPSTTLLSLMPLAMRFAGPREAVWHAIIRRNYGATHLIVGRDHAGPGPDSHGVPFYGPYDAQAMAEHYSHEIGVRTILARELAYLTDEDRYVELAYVPHGARVSTISGTQVRKDYLAKGVKLPEWFTRPEVAEVLQRAYAQDDDASSGA